MAKYTGRFLSQVICDAIGVDPKRVRRLELTADIGDVAMVTTWGYVESDDGKADTLKEVIKHYEIRPIE